MSIPEGRMLLLDLTEFATWEQFVFVHLDPDPPPLAAHLGALVGQVAPLGLTNLRFCERREYEHEQQKNLVSFGNCLECGACAIGCPYSNISCHAPRGGYGATYRYG